MISEVKNLISTIKNYKNKPVNNELEKYFGILIDSIEEFIDNSERSSNDVTEIDKFQYEIIENFQNNHIKNAFYCKKCKEYFLNECNNIEEHITDHIQNSLIDKNDDDSISDTDEINDNKNISSSFKDRSDNDKNTSKDYLVMVKNKMSYEDSPFYKRLNENYMKIVPYKMELEKETRIFNAIRDDLLTILSKKFPQLKICIYGSRLTCLTNNKNANLNIFIDTGHFFNSFGTKKEVIVKLLNTICIEISKMKCFNIKTQEDIYNDRILIIKHSNYPFDCHLTVSNGIILYYQTFLLSYLFQETLHQKVCKLINNLIGHIFNSYQIGLLVAFYYQIEQKLPPITCLQGVNCVPICSGHILRILQQIQVRIV